MEKPKVSPTDHIIPCLICDKDVKLVFYPDSDLTSFKNAAFDRAIACSTRGNYGSQVLDMDGEVHFVICDPCFIKKSHKMLIKDHDWHWHNARDYYEHWIKRLTNKLLEEDENDLDDYLTTVKPYFDE